VAVANQGVRQPVVAGTWYPGTPSALRHAVEGYMAEAASDVPPGPVAALLSPHAGYAYSGPMAAHAYAAVRDAGCKRVILVGPLHRPVHVAGYSPMVISARSAYRTPLGDVPIDRSFVAQLAELADVAWVSDDQEHSLEIELPFLQVALGHFSLVPIMLRVAVDQASAGQLSAMAATLSGLSDEPTILVASSDLSHLDDYAQVIEQDGRLIRLLEAYDLEGLVRGFTRGEIQACGSAAIIMALAWGRERGASRARTLAYTTSGDVTGDRRPGTYTVGYLAAAVYH
jgi:MEMO1 family protein